MLRALALVFLVAAPVGCAEVDDVEPTEYVDGQRKLTDDGAFAVELWHDDGQPVVGYNDFTLRVLFPDPRDPDADGIGVPNARIAVDCWMPNADYAMDVDPMVVPLEMGDYGLTHIHFDRAGVWQLDFDIAVGDTVVETVSFDFLVE